MIPSLRIDLSLADGGRIDGMRRGELMAPEFSPRGGIERGQVGISKISVRRDVDPAFADGHLVQRRSVGECNRPSRQVGSTAGVHRLVARVAWPVAETDPFRRRFMTVIGD